MPNKYYYIIAFSVIAVIVAIVLIVVLKKRKKPVTQKDIILRSREIINKCVQAVEPLKVMCANDFNNLKRLDALQDILRFLTPSVKDEVMDIDEKILNLANSARCSGKVDDNYFYETDMLLADRKQFTKEF